MSGALSLTLDDVAEGGEAVRGPPPLLPSVGSDVVLDDPARVEPDGRAEARVRNAVSSIAVLLVYWHQEQGGDNGGIAVVDARLVPILTSLDASSFRDVSLSLWLRRGRLLLHCSPRTTVLCDSRHNEAYCQSKVRWVFAWHQSKIRDLASTPGKISRCSNVQSVSEYCPTSKYNSQSSTDTSDFTDLPALARPFSSGTDCCRYFE